MGLVGQAGRWRVGQTGFAIASVVLLAACAAGDDPAPTPPISASSPVAAVASPVASPLASPPAVPIAPISPTATPAGPPRVPTPGGTTETFRGPTAELGPIVWATAIDPNTKEPTVRVERFPTAAPLVYAVLPLARLETGATLIARWSYNGTTLDLGSSLLIAERDEEESWVEFHLTQAGDAGWTPGVYAVAVEVDGQAAQTAAVRIDDAP